MIVGVPKEIKNNEFRVGLTPSSVVELVRSGHRVLVEAGAGTGSGLTDAQYREAGAEIVDVETVFLKSDLIVKVKEPQSVERRRLRENQVLFTYLHLAPDPEQTRDLIESGATCIAYETVTSAAGGLPLLTPMSEVAGRLAPQVGARSLEKSAGGRGILLGGVPGVPAADVLIIGGGVSGTHASGIALGMGANVTVIDNSIDVLRRIAHQFRGEVRTAFSTRDTLADLVTKADLVIGTVLIPGATAPKLITKSMLKSMKQGSVIVDVSIDQGGCCETSRPTTHENPTYVVDDVVHYCVANMPGAVARTSTFALSNATLPFTLQLANKGWKTALSENCYLKAGLNVHRGRVTCAPVAEAQDLPFTPSEMCLAEA